MNGFLELEYLNAYQIVTLFERTRKVRRCGLVGISVPLRVVSKEKFQKASLNPASLHLLFQHLPVCCYSVMIMG